MTEAIIHSFLLSLGLILPLGVQNVFIFNQGASQKKLTKALPAVITASLCDTILISTAVLGISMIVLSFKWMNMSLSIVGVCFLLYMGIVTWKSIHTTKKNNTSNISRKKQIVFTLSVSLLNPHAILDIVGVIGTSSIQYDGVTKLAFTLTCILVSWIWFFCLALVGKLTGKLDKSGIVMNLFNKFSALIMWGTALFIASNLLY